MRNNLRLYIKIRHIQLIIVFVIFFSQTISAIEIHSPYKSKNDTLNYAINKISFTGEIYFPEPLLESIIITKPTSFSLPHRGVRFLYFQLLANQYSPKILIKNLKDKLVKWENEFSYFEKQKVETDSLILNNFYHQKGFNNFKCTIKFYGNPKTGKNILEFNIDAGERWKFGPIIYLGLDSLPDDIKLKIKQIIKLNEGMDFDEVALYKEINSIRNLLLNSGYFYATYNKDYPIQVDLKKKTNTVVILFKPGIRQRIAEIQIVDSMTSQTAVSSNMKKSLMDIKTGDYYNPQKISQTELNLYSLGTFSLVTIDTINENPNSQDSLLKLRALLVYRKQHAYHAGLFFNQTTWDQAYNIGVEANYSNKNIFGAAQVFNPFVKFTLLDISRAIQNWPNYEYELSAGINFSQPMLWNLPGFKVGIAAQPQYSYRIFNKFLNLETWSLPITFQVNLPEFTFFQNLNFKFTFERQDPKNFNSAISKLLGELENGNSQDTFALLETFTLYDNLNTYIQTYNPVLTANLLGVSISGDKRNNPFSPTQGYFANVSIEGLDPLFFPFDKLQGDSKFWRFQFMYLNFHSFNPSSILALKLKAGYIYWWDKYLSYIPSDRQFFAGGANSVRGWSSRRLRYFNTNQLDNDFGGNIQSQNYALDYVGSTTLIEGSIEFRYRFSSRKSFGNLSAEQLSDFGLVGFIDFGNAFQWMIVDSLGNYYYTYKWSDFFTKLALAAGIGFRYETPVGPLRIDFGWPIFDPMRKTSPWIFSRTAALKAMVFHIALGQAF